MNYIKLHKLRIFNENLKATTTNVLIVIGKNLHSIMHTVLLMGGISNHPNKLQYH